MIIDVSATGRWLLNSEGFLILGTGYVTKVFQSKRTAQSMRNQQNKILRIITQLFAT